jgi:general secretion pathway protein K
MMFQPSTLSCSMSQSVARQRGLALIVVLWVLSLLSIMAGSFALSMRREASVAIGAKDNSQGVAIAEAGIAVAEMMLLNPDSNRRWHADGSIYQIEFVDTLIRIRLLAESGKIDINQADPTLLQSLLALAPIEPEQKSAVIGAILDWRDPDDLVNIEGAESKEYHANGLKYGPRNQPFQSIEELQMVLGMNEAILKYLDPLITVHSGRKEVNLATATQEVLRVLPGLDAALIDQYIQLRRESASNGVPTPPFSLGQGITNAAEQNDVVEIIAEAQLNDGASVILKVLVAKNAEVAGSSPFQILKWRREDNSENSLFSDEMSDFLVARNAESKFNH